MSRLVKVVKALRKVARAINRRGVREAYVYTIITTLAIGSLIDGIIAFANWLHFGWLGPWLAVVVFFLLGAGLALHELRVTKEAEKFEDPFLLFAFWLERKLSWWGYVPITAILGPQFVAIVANVKSCRCKVALSIASAVVSASIAVPLSSVVLDNIPGIPK